jgi:hypothetical protein
VGPVAAGLYGGCCAGDAIAGELIVCLRNSVYAVGGVMGVFIASSWVLRVSKCVLIGVRGSSDGSGEKGVFRLEATRAWPLVLSGVSRAGGMAGI